MVVVDKTEDKGKMHDAFRILSEEILSKFSFMSQRCIYKVWLELDEDYVPSWRHKKNPVFSSSFLRKVSEGWLLHVITLCKNRQNEQGAGLAQNAQLRALLQRVFAE